MRVEVCKNVCQCVIDQAGTRVFCRPMQTSLIHKRGRGWGSKQVNTLFNDNRRGVDSVFFSLSEWDPIQIISIGQSYSGHSLGPIHLNASGSLNSPSVLVRPKQSPKAGSRHFDWGDCDIILNGSVM